MLIRLRHEHSCFVKIILGFLVLGLVFDFLDKLETFYPSLNFLKLNRFLKLLFTGISVCFIIFNKGLLKEIKYWIFTSLVLMLLMLFKQAYWDLYMDEFLRYIFIFFAFPLIHFTLKDCDFTYQAWFYKIIKYYAVANLIVILASIIFDIYVFKTYRSHRFGYNGLLLSQGFTPFFYLAATVVFFAKRDFLLLGIVFVQVLLTGVKGVYFGEFLLMSFLVLFNRNLSLRYKITYLSIFMIVFLSAILVLMQTAVFKNVLQNNGIVSALFSYRNDYLYELWEQINSENFNLFLGAIGLNKVRVELQLVDVILFFGVIGVLVYIYFFVLFCFQNIKAFWSKAFIAASFVLSLLSGNLLYIPMAIFLMFLTLYFLENLNKSISA